MAVVQEHKVLYAVESLCVGLGLARASYYRMQQPRTPAVSERLHPRALSVTERGEVVGVLNSERFWERRLAELEKWAIQG